MSMNSYRMELPRLFRYRITAGVIDVHRWATFLLREDRTDVPHGSSFAVTTNLDDTYDLWLTSASAVALQAEYVNDARVQLPENMALDRRMNDL